MTLGYLIIHVGYTQMAASLHPVRIITAVVVVAVIIVHLLLFLIERAAEAPAKFAGALANVRL